MGVCIKDHRLRFYLHRGEFAHFPPLHMLSRGSLYAGGLMSK